MIANYEVAYPNPIKLVEGEKVVIEKWETNPEWKGWVFCVSESGVKGWVPETYLRVSGNAAIVLKPYDATELAVTQGENVQPHYSEFGWTWVENNKGQQG
ncbi:hypothetical protein D5038_19135 [Verminephrobacter aporrectodeae subsp. tuberculatae]|nr:hypothetical protein [Verminephrobacter aporrectodeae subsp. tuberculatae]